MLNLIIRKSEINIHFHTVHYNILMPELTF